MTHCFPNTNCHIVKKKFRCVTHCIFDLDGTILNSEKMYHDVVGQICKKYGKIYTKEIQNRMIGGTDRHICEYVVKELKIDVSVDEFESELLRLSEKLLPKAPLQKGVKRLLFHLRDNKIPVALATNSTASQVRQHAIAKPQIFEIFNHVVTATDPGVYRGKPYPDLFLAAAHKFPKNPHPCECLVFEDSLVGLQAGLSAGMQVILTPHANIDTTAAEQATMVLDNLLDFEPQLFGLPPFNDGKPRIPQCPPPQGFKPPPSAFDPCAQYRQSKCCELTTTKCQKQSECDWSSIIENPVVLTTVLIGVTSAIIYRLW
ncbi:unnamed protein product [Arctia plantaginis]|uniref:Uncharacterized protein n=1 Tax=Arctia plantaginis TaxID=874455 RepID=A0A8S1B4P8_ARCPL|nr:unnamed protein product [Arctia plantaginis]